MKIQRALLILLPFSPTPRDSPTDSYIAVAQFRRRGVKSRDKLPTSFIPSASVPIASLNARDCSAYRSGFRSGDIRY